MTITDEQVERPAAEAKQDVDQFAAAAAVAQVRGMLPLPDTTAVATVDAGPDRIGLQPRNSLRGRSPVAAAPLQITSRRPLDADRTFPASGACGGGRGSQSRMTGALSGCDGHSVRKSDIPGV
ncbi:hypothetical protein GCM10010442_50060 [Kitasatospora kifunensis]